jgi:hypothetical protein
VSEPIITRRKLLVPLADLESACVMQIQSLLASGCEGRDSELIHTLCDAVHLARQCADQREPLQKLIDLVNTYRIRDRDGKLMKTFKFSLDFPDHLILANAALELAIASDGPVQNPKTDES